MTTNRIATSGTIDFWKIGDAVYRATTGVGFDIYGVPNDARWESSYTHWIRYRETAYNWAKDVSDDRLTF